MEGQQAQLLFCDSVVEINLIGLKDVAENFEDVNFLLNSQRAFHKVGRKRVANEIHGECFAVDFCCDVS